MKKLLVLGGKPIGSCEIVKRAREKGIYTIVADYLSDAESPAKKIADEAWLISTSELDILEEKARLAHIDGVVAGVHEFNIEMSIKLNERLGTPNFCMSDQWQLLVNKSDFKKQCKKCGIPVTEEFKYEDLNEIKYPVICKPSDSSGSRGFSICRTENELKKGYQNALNFSVSKQVLIEKFMPYDSVIIHYTLIDGEAIFSGMSDKKSMLLNGGGSVMALQEFPAKNIKKFISNLDSKTKHLFANIGLKNGVAWIEAFDNNGEFTFNEMGYRFGGSLTNYPVKYFTGYDQLDMIIDYSVGLNINSNIKYSQEKSKYAILPLHVKKGKIKSISGIEEIEAMENVFAYVPVHFEGDTIENWGSAQQVICYIHIIFDRYAQLRETIKTILSTLKVESHNNKDMLFCLYDINKLGK